MELACISVSANWVNYTVDGHLLKGGWWGWGSFSQQGSGTCSIFQAVPPVFARIPIFFNNFDFSTVFPQAVVPPAVWLWLPAVSPALGVPGVTPQWQCLCPRCLFLPRTVRFLVSEGLWAFSTLNSPQLKTKYTNEKKVNSRPAFKGLRATSLLAEERKERWILRLKSNFRIYSSFMPLCEISVHLN